MEDEDQPLTVKHLISYLMQLPSDAELFTYGGYGGFLSLDTVEEIERYFKCDPEAGTLFINHIEYEEADADRVAAGKEWADIINDEKKREKERQRITRILEE